MKKVKIKSILIWIIAILLVASPWLFNNYLYSNILCKDGKCKKLKNEKVYINEADFQTIVTDELYVLLRLNKDNKKYTSLDDITDYDIFSLVFDKLELFNPNSIEYTAYEVEDIYKNAICLTKLNKLEHKNFKNFYYVASEKTYVRQNDMVSTIDDIYANVAAVHFSKFKKVGKEYKINANYLFVNSSFVNDKGVNLYGRIEDLNDSSKSVVSLKEASDPQKYMDDNFSKIRNKLDTYHYTFKVLDNGRTFLTDFSVD